MYMCIYVYIYIYYFVYVYMYLSLSLYIYIYIYIYICYTSIAAPGARLAPPWRARPASLLGLLVSGFSKGPPRRAIGAIISHFYKYYMYIYIYIYIYTYDYI